MRPEPESPPLSHTELMQEICDDAGLFLMFAHIVPITGTTHGELVLQLLYSDEEAKNKKVQVDLLKEEG